MTIGRPPLLDVLHCSQAEDERYPRPLSSPSRMVCGRGVVRDEISGCGSSTREFPLSPPSQSDRGDRASSRQQSREDAARSRTAPPMRCASRRGRRPLGRIRPLLAGSPEPVERCSLCTKEDYWVIHDAFESMDRRGIGAIRRMDYVWALGAHGTCLEFRKTLRRAGLNAYFHGSSEELPLEAFIRRIFPNIVAEDLKLFGRWAHFRKARCILTTPDFKATDEEFLEVFSHLDEDDTAAIPVNELVRANILERDDIHEALPPSRAQGPLTPDEFCKFFRDVIVRKYTCDSRPDRPDMSDEDIAQDSLREAAASFQQYFHRCARVAVSEKFGHVVKRSKQPAQPPAGTAPTGSPVARRALRMSTEPVAALSNDSHLLPRAPASRESGALPQLGSARQGYPTSSAGARNRRHHRSNSTRSTQAVSCGAERAPAWRAQAVVCAF